MGRKGKKEGVSVALEHQGEKMRGLLYQKKG